MNHACDKCLTRARVLQAIAPRIGRLVDKESRPVRGLLARSDRELLEAAGIPEAEHGAVLRGARAAARADAARELDGGVVCIHDERYPEPLRNLPDRPHALFHTGPLDRLTRLVAGRPVAIVGSREPSPQAKQAAYALGRGLSAAGVTVVSGMAFGIDAACHLGSLDAGAAALAVLASGADRASPASNRDLYRQLRSRGTIVSEMPWGAQPRPWLFPARNRIMAALSEITVVVEARLRSGSLITAEFAQDLGRTVGAMPGPTQARLTAGSNDLLKDGAAFIRDAADVLDELFNAGGAPMPEAPPVRRAIAGDPALGALLDGIEVGETLEQIGARAGLAPRELRAALARLEGIGLIRRAGLRGYVAIATG